MRFVRIIYRRLKLKWMTQTKDLIMLKSGCQRKPGKMLKMSTEGGQRNKLILTS